MGSQNIKLIGIVERGEGRVGDQSYPFGLLFVPFGPPGGTSAEV